MNAVELAVLVLIEKDQRLAEYLREEFASAKGQVEVVHADAVEFDKRPLFVEGEVKLIGNLPYSAATPIMRNFLEQPTPVSRAVLMLQKEVAELLHVWRACSLCAPSCVVCLFCVFKRLLLQHAS